MEIFWAYNTADGICRLDSEESAHCCRVMRHRCGDSINVIDGRGTMYECTLEDDNPKGATARIITTHPDWGGHGYRLTMAVCPTKNIDRYEWFCEKAVEFGVDRIVPVIGEHSERKVVKRERIERILLSAAKQSLKAAVPELDECTGVIDFVREVASDEQSLKLVAYCHGDERREAAELIARYPGKDIIVLIGPEGDFSGAEIEAALNAGFIPVSLGASRLRTETAALAAVALAYFHKH